MVAQFMERAAENAGLPPRALSDDALAALRAYDWPGNVRQLRNIIEWVLIMAPGRPQDPVRPDMLPPEIGASAPGSRTGENGEAIMSLPLREAREVLERSYLEDQVRRFGGNISRTARFVGMEGRSLPRNTHPLGVGRSDHE